MPAGPAANPAAFTAFVESMPDGAALFEVAAGASVPAGDSLCVYANAAFWHLLGRSPSQPAERRLADFSFARVHLERLAAVMAEGEPARFDSYADDIGKSFRVSAFRAGEGRLSIVLRDTTAERHAEAGRLRFVRQTTGTDSLVEGERKRQEFEGLFRNTVENIPINFILYVYVNADPARIAQVAANLVSNAVKFTPSGGKATITVSLEGESRAVLRVVDTGIGIDPALLPKLFVPFTQADRTLDRSSGGLGLGLALVKGLVELHDGKVEARSGGPGRGTEIIVRLPLERVAVSTTSAAAPSVSAGIKRRVLVIEDDGDLREALRVALKLGEYDVDVARTGAEAIEMARRLRPDVVLCDIGLPGMSGYEVARAFRADPALADVALVALSGYAQASDVARAQDAGFDCHVAKPASIPKIQMAIAAATRSSSRNP